MSDCIEHTQKGTRGYGHNSHGKLHRLAYCEANGVTMASIVNLQVLHSCDNPRCINPEHLRLGTHADNMQDKKDRQRGSRHTAKIDYVTAEAIRADYAAGGVTQRQLAAKYGVCQYIINRVIKGLIWRYA